MPHLTQVWFSISVATARIDNESSVLWTPVNQITFEFSWFCGCTIDHFRNQRRFLLFHRNWASNSIPLHIIRATEAHRNNRKLWKLLKFIISNDRPVGPVPRLIHAFRKSDVRRLFGETMLEWLVGWSIGCVMINMGHHCCRSPDKTTVNLSNRLAIVSQSIRLRSNFVYVAVEGHQLPQKMTKHFFFHFSLARAYHTPKN